MCDELNDARIDEASRVRVWLRTIDAFVEEHETIIKENGAQGFKPLATAYLKHIEEASSADENIDFGDLTFIFSLPMPDIIRLFRRLTRRSIFRNRIFWIV